MQLGGRQTAAAKKCTDCWLPCCACSKGMERVIQPWYSHPFQDVVTFQAQSCAFDTIIFCAFPEHHEQLVQAVLAKSCAARQRFAVVIHTVEGLAGQGAAPAA